MNITLSPRTEEAVKIFFAAAQKPEIKAFLPLKAKSVDEALEDYRETLLPSAASFGRIIKADGIYIGDVWCYCIDNNEIPNAMLSFCIFDTSYWRKGIASKAVSLFLKEAADRYELSSVGAFTYSDNLPSIGVLEKNGFSLVDSFIEDGRESSYYQLDLK